MISKNDIIEIEITGITSEGYGVGRYDGIAIFVPYTAIGDRLIAKIIKVKSSYAYGIIEKILKPSDDRIQVDCEVFSKCGGCTYRHISYEAELKIKENIVKNAFIRLGKLSPEFEPIIPCTSTEHYRNKAQYPVAEIDGKIACGFYSKRSHRVVPFTACKIQSAEFEAIVDYIIDYANKNDICAYNEETHKGLLRHIYLRKGFHSNEIMVCLVATENISNKMKDLYMQLSKTFSNIKSIIVNVNPDSTNVILGRKNYTVFGEPYITDVMCGNRIILSSNSFYQVNTEQAEKLYSVAEEYAQLSKDDALLDLYCGVGTIGLSMSKKVKKLIGVEIVENAVENAIKNAELNSMKNVQFNCLDTGKMAEILFKNKEKIDVIIVDPPRKGCDNSTLQALINIAPKRIVMVSCNPSTAARDCSYLNSLGYNVIKVRSVDMFARTVHVECVVLMSRVKD